MTNPIKDPLLDFCIAKANHMRNAVLPLNLSFDTDFFEGKGHVVTTIIYTQTDSDMFILDEFRFDLDGSWSTDDLVQELYYRTETLKLLGKI